MRRLMKNQWHDLRDQLLKLDDSAEPERIFATLVAGFRKYRAQFSSKPFSGRRFAQYFSMKAVDYPVKQSAMRDEAFRHFKTAIEQYEVRTHLASIEGILHDAMEQLLVIQVEQRCPVCGPSDFMLFKAVGSGQLVLECQDCFHVQGCAGEPYDQSGITYARNDDLGPLPAPVALARAPDAVQAKRRQATSDELSASGRSPRIRVDSGEMLDYNLVVLSRRDEETDSSGALISFYRGMPVAIFDEDTDEQGRVDDLVADGHAEPVTEPPRWCPDAKWLCKIDKAGIRHASGAR
ncbi:hypothetical protein PO883_28380 [Massilia sp. DJPM01]|uniref:hypothetical protein n=1 Tax=Massilia sp. DJPM01 TaxID=3024404 RepID=UPI00259EDF2C|nr:hypothetical protein [Massilia sp. DJPM01]MDM5181105.1 hypothetical protein [Massilia sp. DJPM01]